MTAANQQMSTSWKYSAMAASFDSYITDMYS